VGFGSKQFLQRENGASKRRGRGRGRKEGNLLPLTHPHIPFLALSPFSARAKAPKIPFFAPKPHGNACYAG